MEVWKKQVAAALEVIKTPEGETFIARPRVLLVDEVDNTMNFTRVQKKTGVATDDQLAAATKGALDSQARFKKAHASKHAALGAGGAALAGGGHGLGRHQH